MNHFWSPATAHPMAGGEYKGVHILTPRVNDSATIIPCPQHQR